MIEFGNWEVEGGICVHIVGYQQVRQDVRMCYSCRLPADASGSIRQQQKEGAGRGGGGASLLKSTVIY